jgi:hypothetical protein
LFGFIAAELLRDDTVDYSLAAGGVQPLTDRFSRAVPNRLENSAVERFAEAFAQLCFNTVQIEAFRASGMERWRPRQARWQQSTARDARRGNSREAAAENGAPLVRNNSGTR